MTTNVFRQSAFLIAALTLSVATSRPAEATTMVQLTRTQIIDASDIIVRGKVVEIWTEQSSDGTVWTRTQINVADTLKGEERATWIIDQMGGTWGETSTVVAGRARFSPGEKILLFAERLGNGRMIPVGMRQGKFTLRMDPYSQEMIAQRFAPGHHREYDHRFIPLPAAEDRELQVDLESDILDRLENGWDGQPIPGKSLERLHQINANLAEVK